MVYGVRKLPNKDLYKVFNLETGEIYAHQTKDPYKVYRAIEAQKHNPSKVINGLRYFISEKPNKKLKVKVNDKWVHFGNSNYQHYFDKTGLLDNHLNHLDDDRRRRYIARASKIKDKDGNLTADDINSPNYHSINILW